MDTFTHPIYIATYPDGHRDSFAAAPTPQSVLDILEHHHGGYLDAKHLDDHGNGYLCWCDGTNRRFTITIEKGVFIHDNQRPSALIRLSVADQAKIDEINRLRQLTSSERLIGRCREPWWQKAIARQSELMIALATSIATESHTKNCANKEFKQC